MADFRGVQIPQGQNTELGSSFVGGIKSGQEYASAKALVQYRQAEMQRQQVQLQQAQVEHEKQVGQMAWSQLNDVINDHNPKSRMVRYQWFKRSMSQIGIPVSDDLEDLVKNDSFRSDLQQSLYGINNSKDPNQIADAQAQLIQTLPKEGPAILRTMQASKALAIRQQNTDSAQNYREENLDLRKQALGLRGNNAINNQVKIAKEDNLRADNAFQKLNTGISEIDQFLKNPNPSALDQMLSQGFIHTARSGGAISVFRPQEQDSYPRAYGVLNQISQKFSQLSGQGPLTQPMIDDIKHIRDEMKDVVKSEIGSRVNANVNTLKENLSQLGLSKEDIDRKVQATLTTNQMAIMKDKLPGASKANSATPEQLQDIKTKMQALPPGTPKDTIKQGLQKYATDQNIQLTPEHYKDLGLADEEPAAPEAAAPAAAPSESEAAPQEGGLDAGSNP